MTNGNQMVPLDQFGPVADVFAKSPIDVSRFTSGIGMAWPILTIKGKNWGWRFRGESHTYDAPNPAAGGAMMAVQFMDVVLVDAGTRISKVYYKAGYVDGQRTPPDCWSADGITPDEGASEKQANTCRGCRHNVFGSKIGDGNVKGKACSDNKRLAVVTLADLANTDFGGPFMLRLPPGSFSNYTTYVGAMAARGYPPYAIVTRLMFDNTPHPKVLFSPVRPLTAPEAKFIIAHQENPRTAEMLNDKAIAAFADPDEEVAVGGLPTAEAAATTASAWDQAKAPETKPVADPLEIPKALDRRPAEPTPPISSQPVLTPAQQEIADLKAKLAAAEKANEAPEPPPPPVLTPEQMEIAALKAKLAEAEKPKRAGRPRTKPVAPPETMGVTPAGNGAAAPDAPNPVGNQLSDRIAKLAGNT